MKKTILCGLSGIALFSAVPVLAGSPLQHPDCGNIERLSLYSPQMRDSVTIDVWMPDLYMEHPEKRFPVIYMHDGQNLFDASTTWNHQSWEMDSVMCSLTEAGLIDPAIVVGIHSSAETRVGDLMPVKAVAGIPLDATLNMVGLNGYEPRGDAYAAFMVETLKPTIDAAYHTLPDMRHTTVMGSSMGGLMSIYALCEYPDVFGNALCLSTHWVGTPEVAEEFTEGMYNYIAANLPSPERHRLYFDHGTTTIDASYGPAEERILKLVRSKGYGEGTLLNMVDEGAPHEESAWSRRVDVPLRFLLGKEAASKKSEE